MFGVFALAGYGWHFDCYLLPLFAFLPRRALLRPCFATAESFSFILHACASDLACAASTPSTPDYFNHVRRTERANPHGTNERHANLSLTRHDNTALLLREEATRNQIRMVTTNQKKMQQTSIVESKVISNNYEGPGSTRLISGANLHTRIS
jgi:hypothetical protein